MIMSMQLNFLLKDCPGIFSYYGIKKLDITFKKSFFNNLNFFRIKEKIEVFEKNFKGNCIFMEACEFNLKKF